MMYRNGVCYEFLPADDYVLAHLARKKGDVFEYFYDFGDHWYHRIEVRIIIFPFAVLISRCGRFH